MSFSKIRDIMYAGALGDAFGYEVEFSSWSKIKSMYGDSGIVDFKLHNGKVIVSDDTQMTLYTLDSVYNHLMNNEDITKNVAENYRDWYLTQVNPKKCKLPLSKFVSMHKKQAPGMTCMSALSSECLGSLNYKINDSKGCGTIMRIAPLAFLDYENKKLFDLARENAALTHGHNDGMLASGFYVVLLKELISGKDFFRSIDIAKNILTEYANSEHIIKKIIDCVELSKEEKVLRPEELVVKLGQGWVAEEALYVGLYSALKATEFMDALEIASNHSGDSDSCATLAGQLFAATKGLDDYAMGFIDKIDVLDAINYELNKIGLIYNIGEKKLKF